MLELLSCPQRGLSIARTSPQNPTNSHSHPKGFPPCDIFLIFVITGMREKQHWPGVSLVRDIVTSATPGDFFIAVLYLEKVKMGHTADLAHGVLLQYLCCPRFPLFPWQPALC